MNKIFKYKKYTQDKYLKSIRFLSKRYYSIEELKGNGTIAIRREDKNRWERRAPLAPKHVEELTKKGIKVLIQPSNLRIFSDDQYKKSGAIITEDISPAPVILGVKEVPLNKLVPNRTYCFFSHTIKAQKKNMPLLDSILDKNIRLIDYEKIVHEGQRLVKFGEFAGYAGMIDFLHGLGDRMLTMGYSTPFLHIGFTHMYSSMQAAKDAVREIGEQIAQQGLPDMFLPMIFVFTGTGSVSTGAREIFELLPHEWITKEQMHEMFAKKSWRKDVLYGTIASSNQIVEHNDPDKEFNKYEYYREPQNYHSVFAQDYGRYASAIINCMYWDHNYPRILTTEQIEDLHLRRKLRLLGVADLSCDLEGSIEVLKTTSSIDHPFFVYDVGSRQIQWDVSKKGIMFLAVDNLPTEIPRDATIYFGDALLPFIEPLALSDGSKNFEDQLDIPQPIRSSIVTSHGQLTPSFKYIQDLRKKTQTKDKDYKKVVVLGSGMVSGPVIDFFANDPAAGYKIIIATNEPEKAEKMKAGRQNISVIEWDANDTNMLKNVISDSDVVISLLPAFMHVSVANICIEKGVSLVTTSYTTKEMQNLDQLAQNAQVTILNEMGLDPGLDHLEAMRVINEAKEMGGEVVSFVSWCGGLPAPEASGNPLAYKFSWSPRGALVAGTNGAVYKQGDRVIELAPGTVFQNKQKVNFFPGFNLEGYLNRDSLSYIKQYGLSNPKTFFRGTLRYEGFCDVLDALAKIGYLNTSTTDKLQSGMTWRELTTSLVPGASTLDVEDSILTYLNLNETGLEEKAARVDKAFNWLGLFSDALVPPAPTVLDALCAQMINKMSYDEGERDLIILVHHFIIKYKNGTESHLSSSLVAYGDSQYSAMARTVGFPAAIAAKLIMNGHIIRRGVVKPLTPDIYVPMLSHLKNIGIKFKHSTF